MPSEGMFTGEREPHVAPWRLVYARLRAMEPNDLVEYRELETILDSPTFRALNAVKRRQVVQQCFGRANAELWAADSRSCTNIRNVGYRMLQAGEHATQALAQQRRSASANRRAVKIINAARGSEMTPTERSDTWKLKAHLATLARILDKTVGDVEDHEKRIQDLENQARKAS